MWGPIRLVRLPSTPPAGSGHSPAAKSRTDHPASPRRLPELTFQDGAGQNKTWPTGDRTVLLNLWATWCVPCRKEMPALDALQENSAAPARGRFDQHRHPRLDKPKTWLKRSASRGT
jgi:thiol-disulfide isomerase/thioredoxin